MTRSQLLPEILKLDPTDQIMIVEAIHNNLAGGLAPVDEEEFKRELDRRVQDADLRPDDQSSLEDTMTRLRKHR